MLVILNGVVTIMMEMGSLVTSILILKKWLEGLSNVANRVKGKPHVVAMGMRNELRGPNQDKNNWHKYMSQGATTVHKVNSNVLVFVSGLNYDTDLSFLKTMPLNVSIGNKLVYEVHSYAWFTK
ncbi:glycosyl hydrolase 5 family protein [Trifolium repens]|nr:glycosyl hydrolase 5 family protein [Trifolium repens]